MEAVDVYVVGLILCVRISDNRVIQVPFENLDDLYDLEVWRYKPKISEDGKRIVYADLDREIPVKDLFEFK